MKLREQILGEFQKALENQLISTSALYKEKFSDQVSEAAFSKAVSRLCQSGEILRVSKGIYCRPKKTRFGFIPPSEKEILNLFVSENKGVVVKYSLYNSLGITTQIPKGYIVYSSVSEEQQKQIRNITVHKYNLVFNNQTQSIIKVLELLHDFKSIQNINLNAFLTNIELLCKQFNESVFESVIETIRYPKWVIAFLREALDYYHIKNTLEKYLSSLSSYNIPRMEEIYELAQQQN